jgi:hypothetical protein
LELVKRASKCLNKNIKPNQTQGDSEMNSSTTERTELVKEMTQLFSKHISLYIAENPEANIGDLAAMMRQELQTIGRLSLYFAPFQLNRETKNKPTPVSAEQ